MMRLHEVLVPDEQELRNVEAFMKEHGVEIQYHRSGWHQIYD
jgi:hypothetical protein